jgi:hypothetical protein
VKAGRPTDGLAQLDEAERQIEATQERWVEADIPHAHVELLISLGDSVFAEQSPSEQLPWRAVRPQSYTRSGAATSLARLWRDQGKHAEARDLLAPIYHSFTEGFDTPALRGAKAVLSVSERHMSLRCTFQNGS